MWPSVWLPEARLEWDEKMAAAPAMAKHNPIQFPAVKALRYG
jgi:hypothetical protein